LISQWITETVLELKNCSRFYEHPKIMIQNSDLKMTLAKMSYKRPALRETPVAWSWQGRWEGLNDGLKTPSAL